MALGYRLTRLPRKLHPAIQALCWIFGVILGGGALASVTWFGHLQYNEANLDGDRELHRRHVQQLLEIHAVFRDQAESEGPRRFLTGYFKTEEVAKDLSSAYEGAIKAGFLDETGYADCALVRHYLGEENPAAVLELDDLDMWEYPEIAERVALGQSLNPEQVEWIKQYQTDSNDWWSRYLSKQAGLEIDQPLNGRFWYERSVSHGLPYFCFLAFTLLFAVPAMIIVFRRPTGPLLRCTRRWHPSLVLGLGFWALIVCQVGTGAAQAFVPEQLWDGQMYLVMSNLFYLGMQGGPVLILALILTPNCRRFFRVFGLNRFTRGHAALILGLYAVYFLFNFATWEIESRLTPYDTRDFLSPDLIDSGWSGLISELAAAAIIAPVFEELTFRGFLFTSLRTKIGPWLAALISTSVFAGLHFYSFAGIVSVAIFGLLMCWVYQKTRSLWPGILFHALFNLDATVSSWYLNSEELTSWMGIYGPG